MRLSKILWLIPISLVMATSTLAQDNVCLTESQRLKFFVEPQDLSMPDEVSNDEEGIQNQFAEAEVLNGLLSFLETRAKTELQAWAINQIKSDLCKKKQGNALFPDTCALNINSDGSYADISNSYDALVTTLRKDFQNVPACALSYYTKSDIAYYFQSIYEQHKRGEPLELLIYSLANKPSFYKSCSLEGGKLNSSCAIVLPVILHATALLTNYMVANDQDTYPAARKHDLFYQLLQQRLEGLNQGVVDRIKFSKNLSSQQIKSYLNTFKYLVDSNTQTLADEAGQVFSREVAAEIFIDKSEQVYKQLSVASLLVKLGANGLEEDISQYMNTIQASLMAQAHIEAREYTKANLTLIHILDSLANKQGCTNDDSSKTCQAVNGIARFTKVSGAIATLAEAKNEEDFKQKLESLTSPIGSWKRRYEGSFSSINGFFGVAYEHSDYDSAGFNSASNSEVSIFAPIGYQHTWTNGTLAYGVYVSVIDLGNLANSPETLTVNGGEIKSDVESEFDKVFTPGLYFTLSHRKAPITAGIGYSEGPNGYRTFVDSMGGEFEVDKASSIKLFIAVDLALFPL